MLELFFNVIFYIILDQRNLILCLLWICACCTTKFFLVVVVFICSRICPFLLLKCFYFACTLWYI